jgi:hypothetical protein
MTTPNYDEYSEEKLESLLNALALRAVDSSDYEAVAAALEKKKRNKENTIKFHQENLEKNLELMQKNIQKLTVPHWTRNWTFYFVVVSILIALAALLLQWKSYNRDSQSSGLQALSIVDGIQWEMGIAEAQCRSFLVNEKKIARELGSPAWIAQTAQIQNGLASGIFEENPKATAALQALLTDLISLNERNRLMASAAVDILSQANKAWFLKDNLRRYGENCTSVLEDIKIGRPIILNHAKERGLKADLIDFGKIDPFPPRSRAANVTKHH